MISDNKVKIKVQKVLNNFEIWWDHCEKYSEDFPIRPKFKIVEKMGTTLIIYENLYFIKIKKNMK